MKVLLIVPTYGRIPFLNRMLASFLSQNYDDKELAIVNDDKNVELCCNSKNVICVNLNKKILVGQKRNLAVNLGFYDLYMPHDDDDVFLPSRISNNVRIFESNPGISMYHDLMSYIVYGSTFKPSSSGPSCMSFTRKAWFDVEGYKHPINAGEDQEFINKIKGGIRGGNENELDYVYNFGGLNYHLSCASDTSIEQIAYRQLLDMKLLNKKYYIEPDFDEYNKFVELDKIYKLKQVPINITHVELGKIKIMQ
jgi:glycosyltransferase involved in cell wall biosynthesis